jgi:hypothetical protein
LCLRFAYLEGERIEVQSFFQTVFSIHGLGNINNCDSTIFTLLAVIEIHTLKIFILVLALCIPFEIRDLKYDEESLHTLPQVLGVKLSKRIGLLLCAFYLAGIFYDLNLVEQFNIIESVMVLIIGLFIWFSDKFKTDYYASFFVEAIPVLWLVLYIALE